MVIGYTYDDDELTIINTSTAFKNLKLNSNALKNSPSSCSTKHKRINRGWRSENKDIMRIVCDHCHTWQVWFD